MPRIARLVTQFTQKEIAQLFETARRVHKQDGIVLLRAPAQGKIGRILIVISKKVGNAPARNKLRRQIKAIFYENEMYKKEYDWVAILKPTAKKLSFDQLKELFLQK